MRGVGELQAADSFPWLLMAAARTQWALRIDAAFALEETADNGVRHSNMSVADF